MNDVLIKLRNHQLILNAVAGALGGGVGSVFAELVNPLQPRGVQSSSRPFVVIQPRGCFEAPSCMP